MKDATIEQKPFEAEDLEIKDAPVDKSRSAQDYAAAVQVVADLAAIVIQVVPGLEEYKLASKVAAVLPRVAKALKDVAPVLDNPVIVDAVEKAKEGVPDAAKAVLDKTVEVKDAALKPMMDKKAEAEAAKARKEARRSIVESAEAMTLADFKKRFSTYKSLDEGDGLGYLGQPGCYVFLLLGKGLKKDLADYREVYVGSSDRDMGRAVSDEIKGFGNVDVYADAKYGQNLYVLPYPCAADKVEALRESLIVALDANVSYNSRSF